MVTFKAISTSSLTQICQLVRAEVLRSYAIESCIATTKCLLQTLNQLDIIAYPIATRLLVMNQPYALNTSRLGRFPKGSELKDWSKRDNSCSVGLGFGFEQDPDRWAGHLCILVRLGQSLLLVDPSIDQVNVADRLIQIEAPVISLVPENFAIAEESVLVEQNRCLLLYSSQPENYDFQNTPAWNKAFNVEPILHKANLLSPI